MLRSIGIHLQDYTVLQLKDDNLNTRMLFGSLYNVQYQEFCILGYNAV
jgi:hypothetical protein